MKNFMLKIIAVLTVATLLTCHEKAYSYSAKVDSILCVLDKEISVAESEHINRKEQRINDIRRSITNAPDPQRLFDIYRSLYSEYITYQYDSAYHYVREMEALALRTGDNRMHNRAKAALLTCFSRAGFFKEGIETLDDIDPTLMSVGERIDFYSSASSLLNNMESFAGSDADISVGYKAKRIACYDSIIALAAPNTYNYDLAKLKKQRVSDHFDVTTLEMSKHLVSSYKLDDYQKAKIYSTIGQSYAEHNETDSAIYSFAMSAICDLRASIRETTSARNLAALMLKIGDIDRANRYINLASNDAKAYNTRMRLSGISPIMSAITVVHHNKMDTQRKILSISLLVFGIMLLIVILLLLKLRKKNINLSEIQKEVIRKNSELELANENLVSTNTKLKETAEIKDQYIIESLRGKTDFANDVQKKCSKALSKLNGKKYGEVATLLEDIGAHEELARNYASFDSAFIRLFPNFIGEFNKMLAPDAQITICDGTLPSEIRIFALMRVGITGSAEIANYLGLSVSTVYVYKAKIKSKIIIDKSQFEARIMSIPKS